MSQTKPSRDGSGLTARRINLRNKDQKRLARQCEQRRFRQRTNAIPTKISFCLAPQI
jgi:hypothetical protein